MGKIKDFLVKIGVLILIFAVAAGIWLLLNQDSYSEFVVYEHDKLFHKFMEDHEFEGDPIGEESVEVVSSNGKIKVRYSSDQFMRIECESGYNGFSPKIYGVDKNGNFVCDFALCDGLNGYYDPYSKEILDGIWLAESSSDKLVFNVLLLQPFFRAYSTLDLASVMTVEDYELLYAENPDLWGNAYKLIDPENMGKEDRINVWGEDGEGVPGMIHSRLLEPYYMQRSLGRIMSTDTFIENGYDSDFMRRLESRFIRNGYEAPMALARFTIDISGDKPVFDMELIDNISPKNSRVEDIVIENYYESDKRKAEEAEQQVKIQKDKNSATFTTLSDEAFTEWLMSYDLTVNNGKIETVLTLDKSYDTADIYIFESGKLNEAPVLSQKISAGVPLILQLDPAEYEIVLSNESFIYAWSLGLKLNGEKVNNSQKNIFYREIGDVDFSAYDALTNEQKLEKQEEKAVSGANSAYLSRGVFYFETLSLEEYFDIRPNYGELVSFGFQSADNDAEYLVEVCEKTYSDKYWRDDPRLLSVEVKGNMIFQPVYLEQRVDYYLKITRIGKGEPNPVAVFGYVIQ